MTSIPNVVMGASALGSHYCLTDPPNHVVDGLDAFWLSNGRKKNPILFLSGTLSNAEGVRI